MTEERKRTINSSTLAVTSSAPVADTAAVSTRGHLRLHRVHNIPAANGIRPLEIKGGNDVGQRWAGGLGMVGKG